MITVHFDGACPVNPFGPMGMGAHIKDGDKTISLLADMIPPSESNSCNVAEYLAINMAMDWLIKNSKNNEKIHFIGDSSIVINQMSGRWKKQPKEGFYAEQAKKVLAKREIFPNSIYSWIPREENQLADDLSKSLLEVVSRDELRRED